MAKGCTALANGSAAGPSKRSSCGTRNRHFSYVEREVVLDLKPPADLWHFEFDLAQHDMLLHSARPQPRDRYAVWIQLSVDIYTAVCESTAVGSRRRRPKWKPNGNIARSGEPTLNLRI